MFQFFLAYWFSLLVFHYIALPVDLSIPALGLGTGALIAALSFRKHRFRVLTLVWVSFGMQTANQWVLKEHVLIHEIKTDDVIQVKGEVFSDPRYQFGHYHFSLRMNEFRLQGMESWMYSPVLCQVSVPANKMIYSTAIGDELDITARIKIRKKTEPVSLKDHILNKGQKVTLKARSMSHLNDINDRTDVFTDLRSYIRTQLMRGLAQKDHKAVMMALLLGDRNMMSKPLKQKFKACNLFHVFAISGLHMALLGAMFLGVARVFLPLPFSHLLMLSCLFVYLEIVNQPPSAIRAYWMIAGFVMSKYVFRKINPFQLLGTVGLGVLWIRPFYANDPGFGLSFISVFIIFHIVRHMQEVHVQPEQELQALEESMKPALKHSMIKIRMLLKEYVLYNAYVWILLAPMSIFLFGHFSVISPLANMLVLPLLPLILLLGLLAILCSLVSPLISVWLWAWLEHILSPMLAILGQLSDIPYTYVKIPYVDIFSCLILYGVSALILVLWKQNVRSSGDIISSHKV